MTRLLKLLVGPWLILKGLFSLVLLLISALLARTAAGTPPSPPPTSTTATGTSKPAVPLRP